MSMNAVVMVHKNVQAIASLPSNKVISSLHEKREGCLRASVTIQVEYKYPTVRSSVRRTSRCQPCPRLRHIARPSRLDRKDGSAPAAVCLPLSIFYIQR